MSSILKAIFRPISNRHYTNQKVSAFVYACRFTPIILIGLYSAIFISSLVWIALGVIVVYGFVDYVAFDALLDKLGWRLLWRHIYSDEVKSRNREQDAMKIFEQHPTVENYKALAKYLKR